MVAAVVGAVVSSAVTDIAVTAIGDAVLWGVVDAGIAMGSELAVSTAITGAIGTAAGALAGGVVRSALGGNASAPQSVAQAADIARGILTNTSGTIDPINAVYGSRRVGGTVCFVQASGGSNEYLHLVVALCEGEISAINTVYLDGTASTDAKFGSTVYIEKFTGSDGQAACATLTAACPNWDANHKLSGVAYLYVRLTYDSNIYGSIPTITADIDGRLVYDPRDATTKFSNNPALCIRDYLTNSRFGRGIPTGAVDDATFSTAANYCDATVSVPTGTQARYTIDGVVNTNVAPLQNLSDMLMACRGFLTFSGGKYKLGIDSPGTATFAFTEDNIVGQWQIKLPEKRNRANRVRATFFDPANNWQPNIAVQESSTYRAEDNGVLLELEYSLNFTSNIYRAQQIAQISLKASRKQTLCQFGATIAGLRCEVGDLVTITHSTPGWSSKVFRVIALSLLSSDEVKVTALEYDANVYNLDPLVLVSPLPGTNLPDPRTVAPPGVPTVTESLYETTGSAGVKARASIEWVPVDPYARSHRLSYRSAGGAWTTLPDSSSPSVFIDDLAPGLYEFRAATLNAFGVVSSWSAVCAVEIRGLTVPPVDPAWLYAVPKSGLASLSWPLTADLDVKIGGRAVVRHTPLTTGATWEAGIVLDDLPGAATGGMFPLLAGTYMVKYCDSTGHWSNGCASFVASEDMVTGWSVVATSTQHPAFAGSKTHTAVDTGALKLDSAALFDDMADPIDTWPSIDAIGGISPTGSYLFDSTMDLSTVATRNFIATVQSLSSDTNDYIDSRTTLIDDWDDFDGAAVNDCDATLYIRTTNDNPAGSPAWGPWMPFMNADFSCRAAQFRLDLSSGNRTHNISISALSVKARIPA